MALYPLSIDLWINLAIQGKLPRFGVILIYIYVKYRPPAETHNAGIYSPNADRPMIRRPAVLRPSSSSISFTRSLNDTVI